VRCAIGVLLVRAEEPVNLRVENAKEQLKQAKGGDNKSLLKPHTGHRTVGRSGIDEGRSASSRLIFSSFSLSATRAEPKDWLFNGPALVSSEIICSHLFLATGPTSNEDSSEAFSRNELIGHAAMLPP